MNLEELLLASVQAGLEKLVFDLKKLALPSIRLRAAPGVAPLAGSHLGGQPDLPAETPWPLWKGQPMSFIAQIRLEEIALFAEARDLPASGLLSFFYDASQETFGDKLADRGGWQVLYSAEAAVCQPAPFPPGLPPAAQFKPCTLSFESEITLPTGPEQVLPDLHWSPEDGERYEDFLVDFPSLEDRRDLHHRMFGHPEQLQDDMQLQCAFMSAGIESFDDPREAQALASKGEWNLLLQIDSDENAGMKWATDGFLYFWITAAALKECRFDQAWMVLQAE